MTGKINFLSKRGIALLVSLSFLTHSALLHAQCSGLGSITFTVLAPPEPTLSFDTPICAGQSSTIAVNESFSTYTWSTGQNSSSINVTAGGTYTVTVSNAAGCSSTAQAIITQTPGPVVSVTSLPYNCSGSLTLNASGSFPDYQWSTGEAGNSITVTTAGTYTVTATNASGCTRSATFNAAIPPDPVVGISGNLTICNNGSTTLTATPGFQNYQWSGGTGSGNIRSITAAGDYTVTVTNQFGCTDTETVTVASLASPVPDLASPGPICSGQSAGISVSNGPFDNYQWSTGANTPAITVSLAGNYTVTVTDASGCTGTAVASLAVSPNPTVSISAAPYDCDGTRTLIATGNGVSYAWSTTEMTNTITVTTAGTYTVTATNASGCTSSATFNAAIPPDPVVGISGNLTICNNGSTTLTATPGFQNYQWSGGTGTGNIRSITAAGDYTVTVTNPFGCTDTETVTVASLASPVPDLASPGPICSGQSAGISVSNGPFDNYQWSTGANTPAITVSLAGNYTVTVTDASGCTGTAVASLAVSPNPTVSISAAPYDCDGTRTLIASGNGVSYAWSTTEMTNTITVFTDGTYTVTVTDLATGCTRSASFTTSIPAPPQVDVSGDAVFCENGNTILSATGGFSNYSWSNGANSSSVTVVNAQTYTVTATDNFGCTDVESVSVTELPAPVPVLNSPAPICENEFAEIEVSNPVFQSYAWSTGANSASISVSSSGTYTVTVTNADGCTGTDAVSLTVNQNPVVNATQLVYNCNGVRSLSATPGLANYLWSNGLTNATITVNDPDVYSVTVTSSNGCTETASVMADIPQEPVVQVSGLTEICTGETSNFIATIGFNAYAWNTGQTTQSISASATGTYIVTATDIYGCMATASASLLVNPLPAPLITGPTQICTGGSAVFTATGSNFSGYLWSTGETTSSITATDAGNYSVTVTSPEGCKGSATVDLTIGNSINATIAEQPYNCNGQITLDAGGGFQTYLWSNGATTTSITLAQNGTISLTVTDATGCSGTAATSVNIPGQPQVEITGTTAICTGTTTTLSATTGFANYLWSNGLFNSTISIAAAGTYTVTVTDANGCTASSSFTVTENALPQPQILGNLTICNGSATNLSANQNFESYNWSTGETTSQISISTAGNIGLTVTNAAGCSASTTATLTTSNALSPQITLNPYACNGQISLNADAGYQNYNWSNGATGQTIAVTQNGNYDVTVSNAAGCTGSVGVSVQIPIAPQVAISGNPNFCQGGSTALTATAGFQNYLWSNGDNTLSINALQAGNYTVTVTDVNGCTASSSFTVTENALPQPQILGSLTICNGSATNLSANQTFQSYNWSTGETTSQISISTAGNIGLTVTNAAGCSASTSATLTASNALSPQITLSPYACNGQITLNADAGYQNYNWSNGATGQIIAVTQNGNYDVTVSNAAGCTGSVGVSVQIPIAPQVAISGNPNFCQGGSTALTGTTGFQNYLWSNGDNTLSINALQAGNYTVTVTDANGCTASSSFTVTENALPQPQILGSSTICVGGSTTLSVANAADYAQILWSGGVTGSQLLVNTSGLYYVTATNAFGCTTSANFIVNVGNVLEPTIGEGAYNCDGNIILEAPAGFVNYQWSNGSGAAQIAVSNDGNYALTVTDATGCTGTASVFVEVPEDIVVVVQTPPVPICEGGSASLSVPPGFQSYSWSNGSTSTNITVSAPGQYGVTVTDLYGCTAADAYEFNFAENPEFSISGEPELTCAKTQTTLGLLLQNVSQPAQYLWSDGSGADTIQADMAGDYTVTVTDVNGCTASASIEIVQTSDATTFADTLEFSPGEVLTLSPIGLNFTPTNISWTPSDILDCSDCLSVKASPTQDIRVDFSGISGDCSHTGYFYLMSKNRIKPSVFAPNAILLDGTDNNAFTLFGNDLVVKINYLQVYTRWGELVEELRDLAPGDVSKGWKGEFRGKRVDMGVFVWVAEVLFSDGSSEIFKGDVTVFR